MCNSWAAKSILVVDKRLLTPIDDYTDVDIVFSDWKMDLCIKHYGFYINLKKIPRKGEYLKETLRQYR